MTAELAFRCGVCRKKQRVDAQHTGRRAMCPACHTTFVIPTMEQVFEALPERLLVFPHAPEPKPEPAPVEEQQLELEPAEELVELPPPDPAPAPAVDFSSELIAAEDSTFEEVISVDPAEDSEDVIEISGGYESSAVLRTPPPDLLGEDLYGAAGEAMLDASSTQQTQVLARTGTEEGPRYGGSMELEEESGALELVEDEDDLDEDAMFLEDDLNEDQDEARDQSDPEQLTLEEIAQRVTRARRAGEVDRSEELLQHALERYEASGALLLERGHLRAVKGDLEGAVDDFLSAHDQGFDDSGALRVVDRYELDVLLDQAQGFIREEPQRAANLLRGILAERPDYARAHHYLGQALRATGDRESAAQSYARAAELGYEAPVVQVDDPEQALDELEALLAQDPPAARARAEDLVAALPEEGRALELLGEARRLAGDPHGAVEAFAGARRAGRAGPRIDRGLFGALLAAGREEEAAAALSGQLATTPEDPFWRRVQLGARIQEEWFAEALDDLVQLSRQAAGDAELRESLGLVLCWFDVLDALGGLRAALDRDPQNAALAELLADLAARSGDFEQAIGLYSGLLEQDAGRRRILLKRATCWRLRVPPDPGRALEDLVRAFPR